MSSHTITVIQSENGVITPSTTTVSRGEDITFTITPLSGYEIANLVINGNNGQPAPTYTFKNVRKNHTISATFTLIPVITYTITVIQTQNGTITPSTTIVSPGANLTCSITPNINYIIESLLVDNVVIGTPNTYSFINIRASHTITASFKAYTPTPPGPGDLRIYQHGIDLLKKPDGTAYYAIWSSNGLPPVSGSNHDIYYTTIRAINPVTGPNIGTKWVASTGAQSSVNSAMNASQTKICCTWQDNNPNLVKNTVGQVVYISDLTLTDNPYRYCKIIYDGGHSGHVAAVNDNFVVFWCDGWTPFGGVDNLGTGNDVYVSVIEPSGNIKPKLKIASKRAWRPMIAGSSSKACLVWQKYINAQVYVELYCSIFDPNTGAYSPAIRLNNSILAYHYNVKYIPQISRFLIMASRDGGLEGVNNRKCAGGIAWLIDQTGRTKAGPITLSDGIIRESNIILNENAIGPRVQAIIFRLKTGSSVFGDNSVGCNAGGLIVLNITQSSINISRIIDDTYAWQHMGADGFFIDNDQVFTTALSNIGIRSKTYITGNIPPPPAQYTITVVSGAGGNISPNTTAFDRGTNATFTISTDVGYSIDEVFIDGNSVGSISSYTFNNISALHTIKASFKIYVPPPTDTYTITVIQPPVEMGYISPETSMAPKNTTLLFSIIPTLEYVIFDVYVNGNSVLNQCAILQNGVSYTFISIQDSHTISAIFAVKTPPEKLSLLSKGRPAVASSKESHDFAPKYAVDGKSDTRWSSKSPATGPEWLSIDLGETKCIKRIVLNWDMTYASKYRIDVSNLANYNTYATIYDTTSAVGGIETIEPLEGIGRYVRIYCLQRGSTWGYSLYEFEVWGKSANTIKSVQISPSIRPNIPSENLASASIINYEPKIIKTGEQKTIEILGSKLDLITDIKIEGILPISIAIELTPKKIIIHIPPLDVGKYKIILYQGMNSKLLGLFDVV
jgi:hypothetical protein